MATNRKRTPRSRQASPLSEGEIQWLYDQYPPGEPWHEWKAYFFLDDGERRQLWESNRDDVLKWWTVNKPCTRPSRWWKFDAPGLRLRLGGIGTPSHEALAVAPHFTLGIPANWVDQWAVDYYNGRAVDIHGVRIGTQYTEGHFKGLAIDPVDPPAFESQAAYLQRNGLLTAGELVHLKKHSELLEPDVIQ